MLDDDDVAVTALGAQGTDRAVADGTDLAPVGAA